MKYVSGIAVLAAAVVVGVSARGAAAATVTMAFVSVDPGLNETYSINSGAPDTWATNTVGQFNFTVSSNGVPALITGTSLKTWCIDLTQYISTNVSPYSVLGPGFGSFVLPYDNGAALTALFDQYYGTFASNQTNDAAFQLAIWELVRDGTPGTLVSLTDGTFRVSGNDAAAQLATTWLNGLDLNATGSWQVYQLHSDDLQDQIFATQGGGTGQGVPLPTAAWGGIALLAGMGVTRLAWRRRAAH